MLLEKMHIILSLFSGLIIIIFGLIFESQLNNILIVMIATMFGFYIVGAILRAYIKKILPEEVEEETESESDEFEDEFAENDGEYEDDK